MGDEYLSRGRMSRIEASINAIISTKTKYEVTRVGMRRLEPKLTVGTGTSLRRNYLEVQRLNDRLKASLI